MVENTIEYIDYYRRMNVFQFWNAHKITKDKSIYTIVAYESIYWKLWILLYFDIRIKYECSNKGQAIRLQLSCNVPSYSG